MTIFGRHNEANNANRDAAQTTIRLAGCRPEPLMSYLKALAILRLVAEQRDAEAQGSWDRNTFVLRSRLSPEGLEVFLADDYVPTPIIAPWNGGSGFYKGDITAGIDAIVTSSNERLRSYRQAIAEVRRWSEMPPSFNTVGSICAALKEALSAMKPGKKRSDFETMLRAIESLRPDTAILGEADPNTIMLDELEQRAKRRGEHKKALATWWGSVRKARTACAGLERSGGKDAVLVACRSRLPEACVQWLDAVYALRLNDGGQGGLAVSFNPLLGSGANEGRLDYSNNFMQRVADLILGDTARARALLRPALFGTVCAGLEKAKIGQFDPGRAGGFNQGAEIETKDFTINPWDFVLMLEGSLMLASAAVRRHQTGAHFQLASAFAVHPSAVGYSSAAIGEEGKSRAESWLPIWSKFASYGELRCLFGEGRSTVGRRPARTGLDFSRAVTSLGVNRGLSSFVRYSFLPRRGDSYVALPAGRLEVRHNAAVRLLDEVDPLVAAIDVFLHQFKNIPATLAAARRGIDEAVFTCTQRPEPRAFSGIMRALGRLEMLLAGRDRAKKPALSRPLHGLSTRWIDACDDGATELRIAAALASVHRTGEVGSLRCNLTSVDASAPWRWATGRGQRSWSGVRFVERLGCVLHRRMLDAEKARAQKVPLEGLLRLVSSDVMPFLSGATDDSAIEELLFGLTLVGWKREPAVTLGRKWAGGATDAPISRTWAALRLLFVPGTVGGKILRREPRIVPLLEAGRVPDALEIAIHRLRAAGLTPMVSMPDLELDPARLLASLAVPVGRISVLESLVLQTPSTK